MTTDRAQLLARIEAFDVDGGSVALPFAARLAREQGWSRTYADRVIAEYKRFVFLAIASDTPLCPSEAVDAAWHLHLTYTRSYWKRFCGETLGRPLHHEPTKGGPAEADKHLQTYAGTFAAYRDAFGREPPPDVWPPASERFGDDLKHRMVNVARNWVIPRAPIKRLAQLTALFAVVATFVPGCEGGLNPFALEGADFLVFLIPMMIAAVCLGRVIRSTQRGPVPLPSDESLELPWEQAAYLAGGYPRLTSAAVARLVGCGAAAVEGTRLVRGAHEVPGTLSAVEQAVLNALPVSNTAESLRPVVQAVEAAAGDLSHQMEVDGYVTSVGARAGARFLATLPLLAVLLGFALPRFIMGVMNNKPIEYLFFTVAFGGIIGLVIAAAGNLRLTRRGEDVLTKLKARYRKLQVGAAWEGTSEAALAVALFGTLALAGSSIGFLQEWYPRQTAATSAGGCGTAGCGTGGCGAGGGCGGGGGGDGGGGGGCGGCGGGGGD